MAFREFERLSPNRDPAPHERLGALFHHSELGFGETIARMQDPRSRVSYHCLIDADGTRCTLVPDAQVELSMAPSGIALALISGWKSLDELPT